jgi:hypothetical protein
VSYPLSACVYRLAFLEMLINFIDNDHEQAGANLSGRLFKNFFLQSLSQCSSIGSPGKTEPGFSLKYLVYEMIYGTVCGYFYKNRTSIKQAYWGGNTGLEANITDCLPVQNNWTQDE